MSRQYRMPKRYSKPRRYGGWVTTRNYICPDCQYDTKYDGCWVEHDWGDA